MNNKIISSRGDKMEKLISNIIKEVETVINDPEVVGKVKDTLSGKIDIWTAANILGNYYNTDKATAAEIKSAKYIINNIRDFMGEKASTSKEPTTVVFGTSGWRGRIGQDFTTHNVHKVARGIINMMKSDEFLKTNNYSSFEEVQKNGIVVFRDNRFMGNEFMDAAMKELDAAGIKIYLAVECPTGVGSALVTELNAAGSFNFTPSHNPMDYAGLKFNPADGGPADGNLTDIIMSESAKFMVADSNFVPVNNDYDASIIDGANAYKDFLAKSEIFDLPAIRTYLQSVKNDLFLLVDNMHGSSRGYIEKILGKDLIAELQEAGAIAFINTNEDFSFHGVKPEPNENNMKPIIKLAKESGRKLSLVCALDPDGDRIRFGTANADIDMNRFGAIAYGSLFDQGIIGPIASTLPSSDFGLAIAKQEGQDVIETPVGFKWFRPHRDAILCFEESDGISFKGHTLEKDAIAGLLLALDVMRTKGITISEYYNQLQERYGFYYPDKDGVDVLGVSIEEWQQYKKDVVATLQNGLFNIGDKLEVNKEEKTIARISTDDGLKLIFDDNSWILLRPSGTEPKFRVYYEVTSETKIKNPGPILAGYLDAGSEILAKARAVVDNK